jgi:putative aldouronate transport system permease protein
MIFKKKDNLLSEANIYQNIGRRPNKLIKIKKYMPIYILMLPALILLFVFSYIPMSGILLAFKDFKYGLGFWGIFTSPGVGLANFEKFFGSYYFFRILKNTLLLFFYTTLWGFWPGITFAILLNELKGKYYKKFVQTISYLPYFLSTVIIVGLIEFIISPRDGLVNNLLVSLGFDSHYIQVDPKYFRFIYVLTRIWKGTGWNAIIYLAAITSIDQELYEAAIIDGATRFQRIRYITIPGVLNIFILLNILSLGNALNADFELVFLYYSPSIYNVADIIDTYVYREGLIAGNFSYATAVGLFKSIIGLFLVFGANSLAKKAGKEAIW